MFFYSLTVVCLLCHLHTCESEPCADWRRVCAHTQPPSVLPHRRVMESLIHLALFMSRWSSLDVFYQLLCSIAQQTSCFCFGCGSGL